MYSKKFASEMYEARLEAVGILSEMLLEALAGESLEKVEKVKIALISAYEGLYFWKAEKWL